MDDVEPTSRTSRVMLWALGIALVIAIATYIISDQQLQAVWDA